MRAYDSVRVQFANGYRKLTIGCPQSWAFCKYARTRNGEHPDLLFFKFIHGVRPFLTTPSSSQKFSLLSVVSTRCYQYLFPDAHLSPECTDEANASFPSIVQPYSCGVGCGGGVLPCSHGHDLLGKKLFPSVWRSAKFEQRL